MSDNPNLETQSGEDIPDHPNENIMPVNDHRNLADKHLSDIKTNPYDFKENQSRILLYSFSRTITDNHNKTNLQSLIADFKKVKRLIEQGKITSIDDILMDVPNKSLLLGDDISSESKEAIRNSYFDETKYKENTSSAYPKELRQALYIGQNISRLETLNNHLIDKIEIVRLHDRSDSKTTTDSAFASGFDTGIVLTKEDYGKDLDNRIYGELEDIKAFIKVAVALNMENDIIAISNNFPERNSASETNQQLKNNRIKAFDNIEKRLDDYTNHSLPETGEDKYYDVDRDTIKYCRVAVNKNRRFVKNILENPHGVNSELFQSAKSAFQISSRAVHLSHTSTLYEVNKHKNSPTKNKYVLEKYGELSAEKAELKARKKELEGFKKDKKHTFHDEDNDIAILKDNMDSAKRSASRFISSFGSGENNVNYRSAKTLYEEKIDQKIGEIDQRLNTVKDEINPKSESNDKLLKSNKKLQKFFKETDYNRSPGIGSNIARIAHNIKSIEGIVTNAQKTVIDRDLSKLTREMNEGFKDSKDFIRDIGGASWFNSDNKRIAAGKLAVVMFDNVHFLDKGVSGEDIFNSKVASAIEGLISHDTHYNESKLKGFFRFTKNSYLLAGDKHNSEVSKKDVIELLAVCAGRQDFNFQGVGHNNKGYNSSHGDSIVGGQGEDGYSARASDATEKLEKIDQGLRKITSKLVKDVQKSVRGNYQQRAKLGEQLDSLNEDKYPSPSVSANEAIRLMSRDKRITHFDQIQVDGKCSIYYHTKLFSADMSSIENDLGAKKAYFEKTIRAVLVKSIDELSPTDQKAISYNKDILEKFIKGESSKVITRLGEKFKDEMTKVGISKCANGERSEFTFRDIPKSITLDITQGLELYDKKKLGVDSISKLKELNHSLIEHAREDYKDDYVRRKSPRTSISSKEKEPEARRFVSYEDSLNRR